MKQAIVSEKATSASIWLLAFEWGAIFSLVFVAIEFYLYDSFSDGAREGFDVFTMVAPIFIFVLAVKECRDKRLGGSIGFFKGFLVAAATGFVIALLTSIWGLIYYAVDPGYTVEELFLMSIFGQMVAYGFVSVIVGFAMKRN